MISLNIISKLLWAIAISLLLMNSIYFSIKLRFPQFKLSKIFKSIKRETSQGITVIDTLIMSLSSKIGVGSLSGTAICIYYGGIGTLFWIIISSFFLAIISYVENALAIIYKDKKHNVSGPSYYIKKGLNKHKLSVVYAVLILISYTFLFISIQNNTISTLTTEIYPLKKTIVSFTSV